MQITTKFNIGDFVRVINEPERIFSVKGIEVYVNKDTISVHYRTGYTYPDDCGNNIYATIAEDRLKKVKIIDEEN